MPLPPRPAPLVLLLGPLLVALPLASAARAEPGDGLCARDLLVARSAMQVSRDRLDAAGDEEAGRCRAWRAHLATMRRAASVFARCLAGAERARDLGAAQSEVEQFDGVVRGRCR